MPIYKVQGPDGFIYSIDGPAGATDEQIIQAAKTLIRDQSQTVTAPPVPQPEQSGFFRQVLDVPVQVSRGMVGGIRMLADVFGAGSSASEALKSADTWLADLLSAQAKNDQRQVAQILKDAEDKGVLDALKLGFQAFLVAPVDTLSQALGSTAPVIIAGLASGPVGALLGTARVGAVAMPAIGAAMGVGDVKGSIYESVKEAYKQKGASEEVAEAKAQEAQAYSGANLPSMAVAGGLGALAGGMGIEKPLAGMLSKRAASDAAELQALREAERGFASRVGLGAFREGAPEFAQAGQSKLAENIALRNEGFDVPLFQGVFGAAAMEGTAGAILGGGLSVPRPAGNLLPGQKVGESDADFARRLSREIDAARQREQIPNPLTQPISPAEAPAEAPTQPIVSTEGVDLYRLPDGTTGTLEQAKAYAMSVPPQQRMQVIQQILANRIPKEAVTPPDLFTKPAEVAEKPAEVPVEVKPAEEVKPVEAVKPTEEIKVEEIKPGQAVTKEEEEVAADAAKGKQEQNFLLEYPIFEIPIDQLTLSKDVPQFKGDADTKGLVEQLEGKFDQRGVAPIQVWKRNDGRLEVISGRHRFDLAQRSGEKLIRAQIHEEATGFDADQASILDAELNIRDQQGKGKDYVAYFKKSGLSEEEASARGLLGRAPGKPAFAIAKNGSEELVAAHRADIVSDAGAAAIANAAPGDSRLQAVGLKAIQEGKSPLAAVNLIKAVQTISKDQPPSDGGDLFGFDDSAMREAEDMARIATLKQNQIAQRLAAISGASRRPEIAKKEGIDIKDPEALKKREKELRQQKAAWDNWTSSSDLVEEIRKEMAPAEKASVREAPEPKKVSPEIQAKIDLLGKALTRIMSRYGLKDVALKLIADMQAEGEYSSRVLSLALDATDPVSALRHESIHAMKELGFFTDQQWKSLERQAKEKWIDQYLKQKDVNRQPLKEGQTSRYDAYMRLYGGDEEAVIEEAIADAFADFDATKAPPGMLQALLKKIRNFFQSIKEAFGAEPDAERILRKAERGELRGREVAPNVWKETTEEKEQAEAYEDQNGILPYTSAGQIDVPVETPKASIKAPYSERKLAKGKENHPILGVPLNANGTVTLYFPTNNASAREVAKTKRLKAVNPTANRIYLTNESSPAAVRGRLGNIDQGPVEANVMVQVRPELLQFDMEHSDGRKDFFIQLAEGNAFAEKMKMTKLFTLYKPRSEAITKTTTISDIGKGLESGIDAYRKMSPEQRRARLAQARQVLKEEHNVGTLLGENGKLQKTRLNEYQLPEDIENSVASLGLGLASAQKINERNLSTCPNAARCEGLCLGETSGQNELYGGEGPFRAGPRLSQYLKTEALVMHPEDFGIVLYEEIKRFEAWAKSDKGFETVTDENGEKSRVKKQVYTPAIRLNVTSDFPPKMLAPLINGFPDVRFYDYTKLATPGPIADNHHLTYSSDGVAQLVEGKTVGLGSNWNAMIKRLNNGFNVAMAFTSKKDMPDFLLDEKTGEKFQVWNGDNYDARFLDPRPGQKENLFNKGMIIGLTNKDRTGRPEDAAIRYDGFFVDYDRQRDGDTVIIRDQEKIKQGKKVIPIAKPSLRGPKVATWFSGARTLEAALGDINTVMAVESDKRINEFANSAFGTAFIARDVADIDVQEIKEADPLLFHASPVCKNFSAAKTFQGADDSDRKSAEAVSKVILEVAPPVVTIENVPKYASTGLFQNIVKALDDRGYTWDVVIHDAADYGAAQTRNRMLLRAVKDRDLPPLPEKVGPSDWYKQIEDLLIDAPASALPPVERKRLDAMIEKGQLDPSRPIITMGGSGFKGVWAAANDGGPSPTLKAANEKARVLLPDGETKTVTPRMMARLMGLPDSYPVPSSPTLAKTVLGNGIHGNVTKSLIAPLLMQESKLSLRAPQTEAFKRWFGDSKVVDENGEPLVVYHGTRTGDITAFDPTKQDPRDAGFWFGTSQAANQYAASSRGGGNVMPVYLRIVNPKVYTSRDVKITPNLIKELEAEGYDGVLRDFAAGEDAWRYPPGEREWAVFRPEQIKSATGNIGTFDPTNPDIRYSLRDKLGMYSELESKIEASSNKAPAASWKAYINGLTQKGVKPEEIEWSGVKDWLDLQKGMVTKEELLDYLKQGGVRVEETVLGKQAVMEELRNASLQTLRERYANLHFMAADDPEVMAMSRDEMIGELEPDFNAEDVSLPKYSQYTLPGGENYREVLLTLPSESRGKHELAKQTWIKFQEQMREKYNGSFAWRRKATKEENAEADQLVAELDKAAYGIVDYKSRHWDQSNIIAHIRLNDRTDADGNKVLFVEEIQSDWGQEGKKKGFRGPLVNKWETVRDGGKWYSVNVDGHRTGPFDSQAAADYSTGALNSAYGGREMLNSAIPVAPFVTKTEGWLNLALKRIMVMAAEGGYDKVAFVNGEQSADRNNLSKQVEAVRYSRDYQTGLYTISFKPNGARAFEGAGEFAAEKLPDVVGKEIAERIVSEAETASKRIPDADVEGALTGLDLKAGGEGMKTFYDTIVPTAVKKLLPKVGGGQMEMVAVQVPPASEFGGSRRPIQQPGFDVTPAMRNKVQTTGLPRFSLREGPRMNLRDQTDPATRARIDQTTTPREEKTFIQRITEAIFPKSASHFRAMFLNRYNRLGEYDKELVRQMGGAPLLADSSAEAAALMSDMNAGVLAAAMGVHDRVGGIPVYINGRTEVVNNNNTVKGPLAIFAPLAKYNDPFIYQKYQFWAAVNRGLRLYGQGRDPKFITPADQAEAAKILQDHREFQKIHDEWIEFNNGLVKYLLDTGVLTEDAAKEFVKYSDYIPFYRQIDGEQTVGPQIFASLAGVKPPKKTKGSEAPLGEFLETVIRNVQYSIEAGMKNAAAQKAINVAQAINQVQRLNYVSSAPNVVKILEKGKATYYSSQDPLFIDALKSLNLGDLPFIGLLSAPANLLRSLVTKDPAFMLANMMRDSMSAWVSSGVNMTPMVDTLTNFGKALRGQNPEYAALLNSGVIGGYDYSQGVEISASRFNRELRKEAKVYTTTERLTRPFTSLWDALEKGTTASDAATRMEIYKKTLAETGNETEAIFRALEVMNFNRKGSNPLVRVLTAAVPFLNARMQGLDVLYRAAFAKGSDIDPKEVQKRFFVRGMTIAALSSMYWMLASDDDEWKRQEQETRDNYWLIPSLKVKIPIPFEIGVLFKVIPERILEYSFGDDTGKDFMKSMTRQLMSTLAFNPIPQTALPIIEYATNFSFFTTRPIVSQGLEDVAPAYQVGPTTSRLSQLIGGATKDLPTGIQISPVKLDQLINGYTGTIGGYMVDLFDAIYDMNSDAPKAAKRFEQMPVIKRFLVDPQARGQVTAFYELKNSVDEAVRTVNLLERNMQPQEWGEYFQENKGLFAVKDYVLDLEKSMKQYREMKNFVRASNMDADQKKEIILNITTLENQLVSNIQQIKKMSSGQ